jgi:hypothetical protein
MKKFNEWLDNKIINELESKMGQQPIAAPQANNGFQLDTSFDKVVQTAQALYRKTQHPFHLSLYKKLVEIQRSVKDLAKSYNQYGSFNRVTIDYLDGAMDLAIQSAMQNAPNLAKEIKTVIRNYFNFIKMNEKL